MSGRIALRPLGLDGNTLEMRCERCPASRCWTNRRFPPRDHANTEELLFLCARALGWQVEPPRCPQHAPRQQGVDRG